MERSVKVTLTKAEYEELLLTTSFVKEDLTHLKESFGQMQNDPVVVGKVSAQEFRNFLKMKNEQLLVDKLFHKLDYNSDNYLTFWDLVNSLDNFNQKDFKAKLKFYFELYCDQNHEISRGKFLKMSKELLDQFPHLVLPDDFILNQPKSDHNQESNTTYTGQLGPRRRSKMDKGEDEGKEGNIITLDEFYDHFEQVYPALV